jgi:hypothetical protein
VRAHSLKKLPTFKVPFKVKIVETDRVTDRFKKIRRDRDAGSRLSEPA